MDNYSICHILYLNMTGKLASFIHSFIQKTNCDPFRDFPKCYWQLLSFAFEFKSKTWCISCFTPFFLLFRCYWGTWRSCQGWSGLFIASCLFYLLFSAYLLDIWIVPLQNLFVLYSQNLHAHKMEIIRSICSYWVHVVLKDTWK